MKVAVIDFGMGNLRSVAKALEHVATNARVRVTDDKAIIRQADRVVFPGQGAARDCMAALRRRELAEAVIDAAAAKPFLGICMGLQVLLRHSAENGGTGLLGIIAGDVARLPGGVDAAGGKVKVPHIGWSRVGQTAAHPLWGGIADGAWFYFAHSYFVRPARAGAQSGETRYGQTFTAALARDNLFATQFHPEKSARDGLRLLQNFIEWKV